MIWCGRRDSNSHGKPTRPIKPTYFFDGAVLSTHLQHTTERERWLRFSAIHLTDPAKISELIEIFI